MEKQKISILQVILTTSFVVILLICNIITIKQIQLPLNLVISGAALLFPFTYVLSDIFSEVYGYNWSRFVSYLGFGLNLFMVIIFMLIIAAPSPGFFEKQEALQIVLSSTPRVLGASLVAYMLGDYVNDNIFEKLKIKNSNNLKGFGFRAIFSSFWGYLVDSAIFLPLAFLGIIPSYILLQMLFTQVLVKISSEIIFLPITTNLVKRVIKYEGRIK